MLPKPVIFLGYDSSDTTRTFQWLIAISQHVTFVPTQCISSFQKYTLIISYLYEKKIL